MKGGYGILMVVEYERRLRANGYVIPVSIGSEFSFLSLTAPVSLVSRNANDKYESNRHWHS